MINILPLKLLQNEDGQFFGGLNVALGKLERSGLPVGSGIIITPPNLKLKTTLEHFDFGKKEVFEQSLTLVKKEIFSTPVPQILEKEVGKHKKFFINGQIIKSTKSLWQSLLLIWLEEIKSRLWKDGFYIGITGNLDPQVVIFVNDPKALGSAYFDSIQGDTVINISKGKLHPNDLKIIDQIVRGANKKLFIPHQYEWILDQGIKLTKILPFTPSQQDLVEEIIQSQTFVKEETKKSTVKVFLDLSKGLVVEKEADGVFIASEKIFDLNKPRDSFEELVFKIVESSSTFPNNPILFKLADISEGMGKVRGTFRLLHQKNLLEPLLDAASFIRHKRGYQNVHIVIPFVRTTSEFLQLKRELAVKKLMRKNSLQIWLELAVPENIINLEDYFVAGLDGVVLNLDELISFLNGFDKTQEDLFFYKNEVSALIKFLEDGLRLLQKLKVPFIAFGSLTHHPQVLDFLIEKGVYGIIVERYEVPSAKDLLHQAERKLILRRST